MSKEIYVVVTRVETVMLEVDSDGPPQFDAWVEEAYERSSAWEQEVTKVEILDEDGSVLSTR